MFIILLRYKKSLDEVERHIEAHRAFLEMHYQKNHFITSGPQVPRTGGVIMSQLEDKQYLEDILSHDPFSVYGVADYEFIEFTPVKYHQQFAYFINHHTE
jgi:uncharacterized protein YciI